MNVRLKAAHAKNARLKTANVESPKIVLGFLKVVLMESASCLWDSRMVVSGFIRFWKGRVLEVGVSSSVLESGRQRFLLSVSGDGSWE